MLNDKAGERVSRAGRQRVYIEGEVLEKWLEKDIRGQPSSYTAIYRVRVRFAEENGKNPEAKVDGII